MASDMFLKIDGIKGESRDDKHKDEIDIQSWSWGASNAGSSHIGGGGGVSKANVQDLSFMKYTDKASTDLLLSCCNLKHYKEAKLTVRKAGEKPVEYIKITMSDVVITSYSTSGSGDDRLLENVSLNFAKVKVEYTPQKADGSPEAPTTMGWDIERNVKFG